MFTETYSSSDFLRRARRRMRLSADNHDDVLCVTPAPRVVNAPSNMLRGAPAANTLVREPLMRMQPVSAITMSNWYVRSAMVSPDREPVVLVSTAHPPSARHCSVSCES
eukprot:6471044-Amphidinium_carterae.2